MDLVLWLVGLVILMWWVVLPFSIGTTVGPRHPTVKRWMRLASLVMLVGLIVWQLNPDIRAPLFVSMTLGGFSLGSFGTSIYKRDEGAETISYSTFTPGVSAAASSASASTYAPTSYSAPADSSRCARCRRPLQEMAGGVFDTSAFVASVSNSPYPCHACGTAFCVDCMVILRKAGGSCPSCGGALGW